MTTSERRARDEEFTAFVAQHGHALRRQAYLLTGSATQADRRPRLLARGTIGDVSVSTDARYIGYLTAGARGRAADGYDELVVRTAQGESVGTMPVSGRFDLTWDGHVVAATPTDPRGTAVAWDADRKVPGDPDSGKGAVAAEQLSPDGTLAVRWSGSPDAKGRRASEVFPVRGGDAIRLKAPATATFTLLPGSLWQDDQHVLLVDTSGPSGSALVRCDARSGDCEQAPDPDRLIWPR